MQFTQAVPSVPSLEVVNGHPTTLSTQVAEYFGKNHQHVTRDIRNLIEKCPDLGVSNFGQSTYKDSQGKKQPCYRMDRKGFVLLAMGFTGEKALQFKIAYIDAFDRMEEELRNSTADKMKAVATLTPAQQLAIQQAVGRRAQKTANHYQTIYRAIKLRYQIARYDQLPQDKFEDCLRFIETMDLHTLEVVTDEVAQPLTVKDSPRYLTDAELSSLDRIHRFHRDPYFKIAYEVAYNALRAAHSRYAGRFYDVMTECDLSLFRIGRILERNGIKHF